MNLNFIDYLIIVFIVAAPVAVYWLYKYNMWKYRGGSYYTCDVCKTKFYIKKVKNVYGFFGHRFYPASAVMAYCPHCKCRRRCEKNDP